MKTKKYKNGGKTPLTAKQKADIEAEKKRLAAAKRKIARAKADMKKYAGTGDTFTNSPGYAKYIKTKNAVEDSLKRNASPMQKELNEVKRLANEMGKINMFMALDGQEALTTPVKTKIPFANRNRIKDGDDFIRESEKDAEGRYRKGLKKNPDYKYKNGGKMKVKKFKDGGMMEYASGGMLKALLDDPKQREMAKKMLSKEYEGGGMVEYGGGGYMEYDKGGYMSNEQMVMVKADTLEEATKAVKAAVKAGKMTPTHYKVKACFYADED